MFSDFLIIQRKWQYEMETAIEKFEKAISEHTSLSKSGIAHNVQRYQSVPTDSRPDDVKRCELTKSSLLELQKKGQDIIAELTSKKKTLYDPDMNVLPGGKLLLPFIEKNFSKMQEQLKTVENISNSVAGTYLKLCPKHNKVATECAEAKRVRRRKKEHRKSSAKRRMTVLKKHLNATVKLLTGEDIDGSILLGDASNTCLCIDNKNLIRENLSKLKPRYNLKALRYLIEKGFINESIKELVAETITSLDSPKPPKKKRLSQTPTSARNISSYFSSSSTSVNLDSCTSSQLSSSSSSSSSETD